MKVKEIKIKKFKALNNFEALINSKNIFICGENGLGKSSLMQAIQICLGDTNSIPKDLYGKGNVVFSDEEGNDYNCNFTISEDGTYKLELEMPNGMTNIKKTEIKEIFNAEIVHIDEFIGWSDSEPGKRKQLDWYLKRFSEDEKNIILDFKNKIDQYTNTRRSVGVIQKELEGFCKTNQFYGTPIDKIKSISQVNIEDLLKKQENISKCKSTIEIKTKEISSNEEEIKNLEKKILELKGKNLSLNEDITKCKNWLLDNDKEDISDIVQKAKKINEEYSKAQEYLKNYDSFLKKKEEYEDLTISIDQCKLAYENFIKSIDIGLEGLVFDENGLLYNNIPVNKNNMSDSEILELMVKMTVCSNKKTRILCLENSNIIGEKRLKEIINIAEKNNFQIIAEEVVRGQEKISISFM